MRIRLAFYTQTFTKIVNIIIVSVITECYRKRHNNLTIMMHVKQIVTIRLFDAVHIMHFQVFLKSTINIIGIGYKIDYFKNQNEKINRIISV